MEVRKSLLESMSFSLYDLVLLMVEASCSTKSDAATHSFVIAKSLAAHINSAKNQPYVPALPILRRFLQLYTASCA